MATRWAVVSGNWSDPATWNGGTLPTAADDVHADGKTVTIDQPVTVLSIRTNARSGGLNGGTFTMSGDYDIAATGAGIVGGGATCITYTGSGTITVTGNVTGTGLSNLVGFLANGASPTLNFFGNLFGGAATNSHGVSATGTSPTINVTGNCQGGFGIAAGLSATGPSAVVTVTGFCRGSQSIGSTNSSSGIVVSGTSAQVTVVGDATGGVLGSTFGVDANGANAVVSVTGVVTGGGGGSAFGIRADGSASVVNVVGPVTAVGSLSHGVSCSVSTIGVVMTGSMTDSNLGATAIRCRVLRVKSGPGTTTYASEALPTGEPVVRYSADVLPGVPSASDVRAGTTFGPAGEVTGTLAVPPAQSVAYGVPVDNTTGTAALSPADVAALVGAQVTAALDAVP